MVMKNTVGLNIGLLGAQKSTKSLGKIKHHLDCFLLLFDAL